MAWLTGWAKRKPITLGLPSALLSAFPFPARITADTDVGALAQATGYDIRFTLADGTTLLDYERDTFAVTTGAATGLWWVEIPSWSALVATTIYMYYGNASAPDVSSGPNTFDDYVGVYHGGDGTTISVADSSPAGNHGTNSGATAAAGIAGGAMGLQRTSSQWVNLGAAASLNIRDALTASAWVKPATLNGINPVIFGKWNAGSPRSWILLFLSPGQLLFAVNNNAQTLLSPLTYSTGAWMHVAATYDKQYMRIYVNGSQVNEVAYTAQLDDAPSEPQTLGCERAATPSGFFDGPADEARISNTVRAPAWIAAEHGAIAAPASWQTWGAEESNVTARPWLYAARRSQIIGAGAL